MINLSHQLLKYCKYLKCEIIQFCVNQARSYWASFSLAIRCTKLQKFSHYISRSLKGYFRQIIKKYLKRLKSASASRPALQFQASAHLCKRGERKRLEPCREEAAVRSVHFNNPHLMLTPHALPRRRPQRCGHLTRLRPFPAPTPDGLHAPPAPAGLEAPS